MCGHDPAPSASSVGADLLGAEHMVSFCGEHAGMLPGLGLASCTARALDAPSILAPPAAEHWP